MRALIQRIPLFRDTIQIGEFTLLEGIAYMVGAIGIQITSIALVQWLPFFYTPPEGSGRTAFITVTQMGTMMIIGRIMDAISDPVIGTLSDRTSTRWGRRKPYILFGNFPLALSFFLLWFPPIQGLSFKNFIYSTAMISIYWWMFTVVLVPLVALLPEMARSDRGRVTLGAFWAQGMIFGLFLSFILSSVLIEKLGPQLMGGMLSLLSLACFWFTGTVIKERFGGTKQVSFQLEEIAAVLKNRPFLIFLGSYFLFSLGFYIIQSLLPYYNDVILSGSESDIAKYMSLFGLVALLFSHVFQSLEKRFSVKQLYCSGLIIMAAIFPFFYFIGTYSGPIPRQTLVLVLAAIAGIPQAALFVFQGAIIGQAIDEDERRTGRRREAIYSGFSGLTLKLAMSLGLLIMTQMFHLFGFSSKNPLGILLMGPVCALFALLGFVVFLFYPEQMPQ